jgi:hypothetical protein
MTHHNGTKRFPNIKKINTRILQSIIDNVDGRTDAGSDYGPLLSEIIDELYRRQNRQGELEQQRHAKELHAHELATVGKTCPKCQTTYAPDTIDDNFYRVANAPHRYRPRCKQCHIEASRTRRIKTEDIPF